MAKNSKPALFKEGRSQFNCPSCGASLPRRFKLAKIAACESCRSVLYLKGTEANVLGQQAELTDYPSLFQLQHRYIYNKQMFEPVGMLRFSYGRGFWEEWWCLTDSAKGLWVSVDEGDFVMEEPRKTPSDAPALETLSEGKSVRLFKEDWLVTEIGEAEYVGMLGELPELVDPQRKFHYVHLSRPGSQLVTLEYDDPQDSPAIFAGQWLDPFKIKSV